MTKILTMQLAFEIAFTGLYAQGTLSLAISGKCQYRSEEGKRCGMGFLIPDDVYREGFESVSASGLYQDAKGVKELFHPEVTTGFLNTLQKGLHDDFKTYAGGLTYKEWLIGQAQGFAQTYNLTMPEIKT